MAAEFCIKDLSSEVYQGLIQIRNFMRGRNAIYIYVSARLSSYFSIYSSASLTATPTAQPRP